MKGSYFDYFSPQMNVNSSRNTKMRDGQVHRMRKFIGLDCPSIGALWLSGRVVDLRFRDHWFEVHQSIGLLSKKFQRKIVNIFLPIIFSICFGCSQEPSHCFGLEIRKLFYWYALLTKGLPEALCHVLEQRHFFLCLVMVQLRKTGKEIDSLNNLYIIFLSSYSKSFFPSHLPAKPSPAEQ